MKSRGKEKGEGEKVSAWEEWCVIQMNTNIAQGVLWADQSSLRPLSTLLCKALDHKQY